MTPAAPLHHRQITAPRAEPDRWFLFLHGILGSGANWMSFARRLVSAHPDWGAVLADLRLHGRTQPVPPPHTVELCGRDLLELEAFLDHPFHAVSGHSFGGKVALAFAQLSDHPLEQIWVLDSNPCPNPERARAAADEASAFRVLRILESLPPTFSSRAAFTAALVERSLSSGVAQWLGKNLRLDDGVYRHTLDLRSIRDLLDDYIHVDLWPALTARAEAETHVVLAGRSTVVPEEVQARLRRAADAGRVQLHSIPCAGHWLHVDAPDRLQEIFDAGLGGAGRDKGPTERYP